MVDPIVTYGKIQTLIDDTKSELVKKLILDNIFTIVTSHDNEIANVFRQYCANGALRVDREHSPPMPSGEAAARIELVGKGAYLVWKSLLKDKEIWDPILAQGAPVLLIYIPNWKYFDLGLPLYRRSEAVLGLRPVIIHQSDRSEEALFEGLTQINLSRYSVDLRALGNAIVRLISTRHAIKNERAHGDFYQFLFSRLWRSELGNLLNEHRLRALFKKSGGVKAVFSCIPTTNLGRMLNLIARKFSIPTFSIRRGITVSNVENHFIETDFLFAKGEQEREIYRAAGLETRCRIAVVGAPFLNVPKLERPNQYSGHRRIRVLFVDQPTSQTCTLKSKTEVVRMLGRSVKDYENLELVVKLHPGTQHKDVYEREFKKIGVTNFRVLQPRYSLDEALGESDYVIVRNSTVAFNALVMAKPLIVLGEGFFDSALENPFWNERIAHLVPDEGSLHDVLDKASSKMLPTKDSTEIQLFLKRYIDCTGEVALNKVLSFMKEVLSST